MDTIELRWKGPYPWPFIGNHSMSEDFNKSGIYLFTVEHFEGFLIHIAGQTGKPFRERFRQHHREYYAGRYTIFDLDAFKLGTRQIIWGGFWHYKNIPQEYKEDYKARNTEIGLARDKWLNGYRIFVAPIETSQRIRERIEAEIMWSLYVATPPACSVPDRGMMLSLRRPFENPINVKNHSEVTFRGLPKDLVV
jgi:hypothetical protein